MNKTIKPIIVANWKMNPVNYKEAKELFEGVRHGVKKLKNKNIELIICPPFVWLEALRGTMGEGNKSKMQMRLGAQNLFWESKGAFTGEISPLMLKYFGCRYVIVGHSERRKYLGETDDVVNQKVKTALRCGLRVILCVGEEERHDQEVAGHTNEDINLVVGEQLDKALEGVSVGKITDIIIAYEPVWAIGTGHACSSDQAMKAALFIRKKLTHLYRRKTAEQIKILYGGSVSSRNAADYVKGVSMNGLLVGGASLIVSEFVKIIENVSQ